MIVYGTSPVRRRRSREEIERHDAIPPATLRSLVWESIERYMDPAPRSCKCSSWPRSRSARCCAAYGGSRREVVEDVRASCSRGARRPSGSVSGRARGDAPDVATPSLAVEVKSRKALPGWIKDALAQAEASAWKPQLPIVVVHEEGRRYADSLVDLGSMLPNTLYSFFALC